MLFNSWTFAIFRPVVVLVYFRLTHRQQNLWLLGASYLFYGWWDWRFLSLIALSSTLDYYCARGIEGEVDPRVRRRWLSLSLVVNLGILAVFKYFNFFLASAVTGLDLLGLQVALPSLRIILPVGISFYTFQTASYTIDVYRGDLMACRRWTDYLLYVSFFPQLVAGPIERATHLLPQIEQPRRVGVQQVREGLFLILVGLFRKMAVADVLAPTVQQIFSAPGHWGGPDLLYGVYLFSIQIYCDFCGYSNVARGCAKLLGVELMVNFRQPYFSRSVTELWHRWHISLSSWLRDYLYIPLGGNRGGQAKTYRNLMLTMLLGGLWHGASWTFVVWGGLHGIYLAVHRLFARRAGPGAQPDRPTPAVVKVLKMIVTFHLVGLTWIFFRSPDFATAGTYVQRLLTWAPSAHHLSWLDPATIPPVFILLALDTVQYRADDQLVCLRWPWVVRGCCYAVLLLALLVWGSGAVNAPFIYFQF